MSDDDAKQQPFYAPLTWPIGNLLSAYKYVSSIETISDSQRRSSDDDGKNKNKKSSSPIIINPPEAHAELDIMGHLTALCGSTRSFLMALFCMYVFYPDKANPYPAFNENVCYSVEESSLLSLSSWIYPIIIRNIVSTWVICGLWDYYLYFSYWSKHGKLVEFKFNKVYPNKLQFYHDSFYTTISSLIAAIIEILLIRYYWSCQINNVNTDNNKVSLITVVTTICWGITITHWRVPHFYVIHRLLHPWRLKSNEKLPTIIQNIPDVGSFLYRHVHSLHHKSYNPTSFSGTSMHPVESTLYYSAALIPIVIPYLLNLPATKLSILHPSIALGCIIDCGVGAWLGHDGYNGPIGSGDYFHQIHHTYFDCNYGANHIPLDKWFGTFASNKDDVKTIWK